MVFIENPETVGEIIEGIAGAFSIKRKWRAELEKRIRWEDSAISDYIIHKNENCEAGAKGYIGQIFYRMNGGDDPETYTRIGLDSSNILLLYRVCDDAVDGLLGASPKHKEEIIENFWKAFRGEDVCSERLEERAGCILARKLGNEFGGSGSFVESFSNLITHLKKGLYVKSKRSALENSKKVGAYCINPLNNLMRAYNCGLDQRVENAGMHFGAAAQILDDMMDVETNALEKINTYPTLKLKEMGRPLTKKALKETKIDLEMKELAKKEIGKGLGLLDEYQKDLYRGISEILFLRSYMTYHLGI